MPDAESTPPTVQSPAPRPSTSLSRLRKLCSLSGVLPLGGFLVAHLWANARALGGQQPFDELAAKMKHLPLLPLFELVVIGSLVTHAVAGVALLRSPAAGGDRDESAPTGQLPTLLRVSGAMAMLFVGYHLWGVRLQVALGRLSHESLYAALCELLSSTVAGVPLQALAYLGGVAACALHLALGLHAAAGRWGLLSTPRVRRVSAWVCGLIGLALLLSGASTVMHFATGAGFFGASQAASQ